MPFDENLKNPLGEKILGAYYFKEFGFPSWADNEISFFSWLFNVPTQEVEKALEELAERGFINKISED